MNSSVSIEDVPARLEPAIKDFVDALQYTLAFLRGYGDVIDGFSMKVGDIRPPR